MNSLYNTLQSNDGLRAIFIVVFVATILTLYELYMFYFVVVPKVHSQIDNGIIELTNNIKNIELLPNIKEEDINKIINLIQTYDTSNKFKNVFNFIYNYKDKIKNILNNNIYSSHLNSLVSLFKSFKDRENLLINKINNYTILISILLLLFLFSILFYIKYTLNKRGENIGKCVWILSFLTIFLILIFQYYFYIFGNKYNYLGSQGNEELIYNLISRL